MEADPYAIAYIAVGGTLLGAIVGGFINGTVSYKLNKQRAKHELEVLNIQAKQQDRERSVRLKLEKIDRAYALLIEIHKTLRQTTKVMPSEPEDIILKMRDKVLALHVYIDNLMLLSELYLPDIFDKVDKMAGNFIDIKKMLDIEPIETAWSRHQVFASKLWWHVSETQRILGVLVKDQNLIYSPPESQDTP